MKFESYEEEAFYNFLLELLKDNWIDDFTYQKEYFILSEPVKYNWEQKLKTKNKIIENILLHGHIYTPDFWIKWNSKSYGIFYCNINDNKINLSKIPFINNINDNGDDKGSFIEIKGSFDFKNMTRLSTINIKWVYEKYKIFVQKIVPIGKSNCLFAKTFVPQWAMFTKKNLKPKKYNFKAKSINEFLGGYNV